jgi:N-acetylglutamate synthase-like GNAT family acetyltransferase
MRQIVRRATSADYDAVCACVGAAYARYIDRIGKKPAPMLADYRSLIARGVVHVVDGVNGVFGVVVMMPDAGGMFLENIAVHSDSQGRGTGHQLMAFVEQSTREQRVPAVHLYTNEAMTENLAFYAKLGFQQIGCRLEDGYRRIYFRKLLA